MDVKNTFDSVKLNKALGNFERDYYIPSYVLRIFGDCLKDRSIVYDTEDGPAKREIIPGAAEGSMMGLGIWNISYDGIVRMEMSGGSFLVRYADDIAIVIVAKDADGAQLLLNHVMRRFYS